MYSIDTASESGTDRQLGARRLGLEAEVSSADPAEIVSILLREACSSLRRGIHSIKEDGGPDQRHYWLSRALTIVDGLAASVSTEHAPDIAENLLSLYDFVVRQVVQANIQADAMMAKQALGVLEKIEDAWSSAQMEASA